MAAPADQSEQGGTVRECGATLQRPRGGAKQRGRARTVGEQLCEVGGGARGGDAAAQHVPQRRQPQQRPAAGPARQVHTCFGACMHPEDGRRAAIRKIGRICTLHALCAAPACSAS